MAQHTKIELVDDIDGGRATQTVLFNVDGKTYEIDLSNKNATALRKLFEPYAEAGRKLTKARRGHAARPYARVATQVDPSAVRAWAAANGIEVSTRGRLSAEVVERFRAAGN